jgi:hypothetical protein
MASIDVVLSPSWAAEFRTYDKPAELPGKLSKWKFDASGEMLMLMSFGIFSSLFCHLLTGQAG